LQREVDVVLGLEFEDGESAVEGADEHVDYRAIGGGESGNCESTKRG
jgi:hypothetical protein